MPAYPVSVKDVVARDGRILLPHNERGEWELPGGRLEMGETPEQCVVREIAEESGRTVTAGSILDAWLYHITSLRRVSTCSSSPTRANSSPGRRPRIPIKTPTSIKKELISLMLELAPSCLLLAQAKPR